MGFRNLCEIGSWIFPGRVLYEECYQISSYFDFRIIVISSIGNIAVVQSALHIGDGAGFANFRGYIDEVRIDFICFCRSSANTDVT